MHTKDHLGYKKRVKRKVNRPPLITFLCFVIAAVGFWSIIHNYITLYTGIGVLYPAVNAFMVILSFVAISGVWSMEKWGPVSFVIVVILKLLVDALWGQFNSWYLLAFIPAGIFFIRFSKMKNTE
jgi:hypothetical protein